MMVWFGTHWAFWQSALAWLGMLLFWVLVVWVIYGFVTSSAPRTRTRDDSGDARHILDQRLARGEIDADEYRRLRDLIESGSHQPTAGTWPSDRARFSSRR